MLVYTHSGLWYIIIVFIYPSYSKQGGRPWISKIQNRAVAAEGSLSKAAQKLNYAQSNLSTKISQLEKELHTELFHRCSHGVTLTPKGEQLLQYAEKLLNLAAETEAVLKDDGTAKGSLTLGSMESTCLTLCPSCPLPCGKSLSLSCISRPAPLPLPSRAFWTIPWTEPFNRSLRHQAGLNGPDRTAWCW